MWNIVPLYFLADTLNQEKVMVSQIAPARHARNDARSAAYGLASHANRVASG